MRACKLELVHNVFGPMQTLSFGNHSYFVTFVDDRFAWVYPLKAKYEVFMCFKHYVLMVENVPSCDVGTLHFD